jgi:hypothetical protein
MTGVSARVREPVCEFSDLTRSGCSHCTGRTGDPELLAAMEEHFHPEPWTIIGDTGSLTGGEDGTPGYCDGVTDDWPGGFDCTGREPRMRDAQFMVFRPRVRVMFLLRSDT